MRSHDTLILVLTRSSHMPKAKGMIIIVIATITVIEWAVRSKN